MPIGEQVLLPEAPRETLVIADGFSCREQVKNGAGRFAMHPAEVFALALDEQVPERARERRYLEPAAEPARAVVAAGLGVGAALLFLAWRFAAGRA